MQEQESSCFVQPAAIELQSSKMVQNCSVLPAIIHECLWCGRKKEPTCQCKVSYRWVTTGARGRMTDCSHTKEPQTNGLPSLSSSSHLPFHLSLVFPLSVTYIDFFTFLLQVICKDQYLSHSPFTGYAAWCWLASFALSNENQSTNSLDFLLLNSTL